jgi:hypothetical protein
MTRGMCPAGDRGQSHEGAGSAAAAAGTEPALHGVGGGHHHTGAGVAGGPPASPARPERTCGSAGAPIAGWRAMGRSVAACPSAHRNRAEPDNLLGRTQDTLEEEVADDCPALNYELRELPGRRLRRWPRPANPGAAAHDPAHAVWPVLEPHRWLWDS